MWNWKKINVMNNFIFYLMLLLFITILTAVNNYYFYAHVYDSSARNALQLESILNTVPKNDDKYQTKIIDLAKAFSTKAYYNDTLEVSGDISWEKPLISWDKVVSSKIKIKLYDSNGEKTHDYYFSVNFDYKLYLISIVRSMTFSALDFLDDSYNVGIKQAIIEYKKYHAFKRSRPTIGFALFGFILLWLYREREKKRIKMNEIKDYEIKEKFIRELEDEKNRLEVKYTEIYEKLQQYDKIINPPINTLTFSDLISLDTSGIGNKFRKTIEKLFFQIFKYKFNYDAANLSEAIYKLSDKNIISKEAKNYADIIRVYGNIDSHYNNQDSISKDEVIALANYVIKIVEEIVKKKLLSIEIIASKEKQTSSKQSISETQSANVVKTEGGLRIIKKVNKT